MMARDETTMTISLPDGTTTAPFTLGDLDTVTRKVKGILFKNTAADEKVKDDAYAVTADELRQFVERYEQLESEKKDVAEQQKELMGEAKGRGYDTKVLRMVIALRKRKPDEIAETEAVLEMYKTALGMS